MITRPNSSLRTICSAADGKGADGAPRVLEQRADSVSSVNFVAGDLFVDVFHRPGRTGSDRCASTFSFTPTSSVAAGSASSPPSSTGIVGSVAPSLDVRGSRAQRRVHGSTFEGRLPSKPHRRQQHREQDEQRGRERRQSRVAGNVVDDPRVQRLEHHDQHRRQEQRHHEVGHHLKEHRADQQQDRHQHDERDDARHGRFLHAMRRLRALPDSMRFCASRSAKPATVGL